MKNQITYSIEINEVQRVAVETLGRDLTSQELSNLQDSLGDYLDWYQTISHAVKDIAQNE